MAKAFQSAVVKITLELTNQEAEYLKSLTQNYLGPDAEYAEPKIESSIRCEIFNALHDAMQDFKIE